MFSPNIDSDLSLKGRHHIVERVVDNHLSNLLFLLSCFDEYRGLCWLAIIQSISRFFYVFSKSFLIN